MAATNLLTLLDDIAGLLDDVAALTKIATKKTAGVLGDDLALNAQQLTGLATHRELPVVWAVMKGSFINKSILVPGALLISAFLPWAVTPLLMLGGVFLCYEGCEKLAHRFLHTPEDERAQRAALTRSLSDPAVDVLQLERDKIKGAVRTDFILSAEIIAITLGAVASAPLLTQVLVLTGIALLMTIAVYGFVAGVVKLDDAGLYLLGRPGESRAAYAQRKLGRAILTAAPWLMKGLSVAGTAAMFLVGGGILVHGIPWLHHAAEEWMHDAAAAPSIGPVLSVAAEMLANGVVGIVAGALVLTAVGLVQRLRRPKIAWGRMETIDRTSLKDAWVVHAQRHPYAAMGLAVATVVVAALVAVGTYNAFAVRGDLPLRYGLLGGFAGFGATALGALAGLWLRGLSTRVEDSMLGFAAGMMLAAASFSLILPGLEAAEDITGNAWLGALTVVGGLALGAVLMLGLDQFTPHAHASSGACGPAAERLSRVWLFVFAIVLHNLPEGMAIGVSFAQADLAVGLPLTTAIAIQDIPEGLAVVFALRAAGVSALRAAALAAASGIMEPIGAILGVGLSSGMAIAYPIGLGLAAGAMIFVVSHEVIPETHRNGHQTPATLGLMAGFAVMMVLDTAFA